MAVEQRRGCGFRRVGGMYLVGGILDNPCDRLPYPLEICPVCSQGIKVGRGFTQINPLKVFGTHDGFTATINSNKAQQAIDTGKTYSAPLTPICKDQLRPCIMCDPTEEPAFLMLVGEKYYTPQSFIQEGQALGVSKRIPFTPKNLELGKTIVYLVHKKACIKDGNAEPNKKGQSQMLKYQQGIFCAFIPRAVEKLVWEKDLKGEKGEELKKKLAKRNITVVPIPNRDKDHK